MNEKTFKLTVEYDRSYIRINYNDGSDAETYPTDGTVDDITRFVKNAIETALEPECN